MNDLGQLLEKKNYVSNQANKMFLCHKINAILHTMSIKIP